MPETDKTPHPATETPGATPLARIRSGLTRPSRGQLVVGVLLAALGFAAVTQVRSNEADDTYAGAREQDLIDLLNGLAGAQDRAEAEIARLEQTRSDLQSETSRRQAALDQANTDLDTLGILSGQVPATGPGVRIIVNDPEGTVDADILLDAVQELRTADAEVLEFNDQVRVIAQTSFEDGVGGVVVDGQLLTAPYVIEAIGEPHALTGAVTFRQGLRDDVEDGGGSVVIETPDRIDVESVREAFPVDVAQPDG